MNIILEFIQSELIIFTVLSQGTYMGSQRLEHELQMKEKHNVKC